MWVLPNKKGFLSWAHGAYNSENYDNAPSRYKTHQRIVKDYLDIQSPYRGLLFYHGLGTGKTGASIAASEGFLRTGRKVIVILPASLQKNYRKEIKKYASIFDKSRIHWKKSADAMIPVEASASDAEALHYRDLSPEDQRLADKAMEDIIDKRYMFLHYNSPVVVKNIDALMMTENFTKETLEWAALPLNDQAMKYVTNTFQVSMPRFARGTTEFYIPRQILDIDVYDFLEQRDVRFNIKWPELSEAAQKAATKLFENMIKSNSEALRQRFKMTRSIFDNACIVIDEVHTFINSVSNNGKLAVQIYDHLMQARKSKLILLSGTPVVNHPFELALIVNLIRGPIVTHSIQFPDGITLPTIDELTTAVSNTKSNTVREIISVTDTIDIRENAIRVTLMPFGFKRASDATRNFYISRGSWQFKRPIEEFKKILARMVSVPESEVNVGREVRFALPTKIEDFESMFMDNTDPDNPAVKNADLFIRRCMGTTSYFRSEGMAETKPLDVVKLPMPEHQFSAYLKVRENEIKMEKRRRVTKLWGQQTSTYRAFSRMVSNFAFPLGMNRRYPSEYRESIMVNDVLDDKNEYQKKYKAHITELIGKLRNQSRPGVPPKDRDLLLSPIPNLMKYSAKFAHIVHDVKSSPGPALVYSEYRHSEGIAVLSEAFFANNFRELKIEFNAEKNDWEILTTNDYAKQLLRKSQNGLRYIIYPSGEAETQAQTQAGGASAAETASVLIDIFNGKFDKYPTIAKQINDAAIAGNDVLSEPSNLLHGELVKMMMITKSAAEGISLHNVRTVMITEPFWNMSRIYQVIGRAVRMGSHARLPEEEQVVTPKLYISSISHVQQEQVKMKHQTVWKADQRPKPPGSLRPDSIMTTDEHIFSIASKKDIIVQQFFKLLQRGAMDCTMNASKNKPSAEDACYSFAVNDDPYGLSYSPDLERDVVRVHQEELIVDRNRSPRSVKDGEVGGYGTFKLLDQSNQELKEFYYKNRLNRTFASADLRKTLPPEVYKRVSKEIKANRIQVVKIVKKYVDVVRQDREEPDRVDYNAYRFGKVIRPWTPPA